MPYPLVEAKKRIATVLQHVLKEKNYPTTILLERPPEGKGTFAFPCFQLCSLSKKSPQQTAEEIQKEIKKDTFIKKTEVSNGYLNFYLNQSLIIQQTLSLILKKKETYGTLPSKKKKVIVEHTSANPNGPLHVGRARNPIIGDTITRLFTAAGYETESQFYVDDMGKQVAILAWGMNQLDTGEIPKPAIDKPDHHAVGFYQEANKLMEQDKNIQQEIGMLVQESEQGNQQVLEQIHNAYEPVLKGMKQSLQTINISIDRYIPESTFVKDKSVEKIINSLKKTPICSDEDGAYYLDLASHGIKGRNTKFFFTRKDGTSLYATRDIAYHAWKAQHADKLVNILGEDHKLESKQVAIGLELIGETHLPHPVFYSFVSLPGGKMSTRKGRMVSLDDLIQECIKRAYEEVKKRRGKELNDQQMNHIAKIVGTGALRYNIIKVQPEKDIVFKWKEALSFDGNAAPFIQYAHARASGILAKQKAEGINKNFSGYEVLTEKAEQNLAMKLAELPELIRIACEQYRPHQLCSYVYEVASLFNQFYRDCPVITEKDNNRKQARLHLVLATKIVLHNGLDILGISAPEEM